LNTSNFFNLVPTFSNGVKALHNELLGVALVLAFAGLLVHVCSGLIRRDAGQMFPTLVRLALISILITSLESWGDALVGAVTNLISEMGASGAGGNIFTDYQQAIARKMGTAAAAANLSQSNQALATPIPEGDMSAGFATQPIGGITLTDYGYEPPGSANYDSNSAQGIGAFSWDSAPGSLIPNYSAALSPDVAAKYNLQPGQQFTVTTAAGQTYNLVYADKTSQDLTGRVDIYSPSGELGGDSFSQAITSLDGGPVVQGQSGFASFLPNQGGSIGDQILWAITLGLSWIASSVMWLMQIAQQLLYLIEIAISPVFIALLMIPALTHLARRFFTTLVAICLWPLAWAICDLVTKFLIDLAVNPSNNTALGIANTGALVSGPLAGLAYLIVVAVWVIGSTLAAPLFIGHMLSIGGSTATAAVFGATLGAAASRGMQTANSVIGGASGVANFVGGFGSNGGAYFSPRSGSRINGLAQNYARRPIGADNETKS
jgi:hypothetical protein